MLTRKQMQSIPPKPLKVNAKGRHSRGTWETWELNKMFPDQKRNKTFAELLGQ